MNKKADLFAKNSTRIKIKNSLKLINEKWTNFIKDLNTCEQLNQNGF